MFWSCAEDQNRFVGGQFKALCLQRVTSKSPPDKCWTSLCLPGKNKASQMQRVWMEQKLLKEPHRGKMINQCGLQDCFRLAWKALHFKNFLSCKNWNRQPSWSWRYPSQIQAATAETEPGLRKRQPCLFQDCFCLSQYEMWHRRVTRPPLGNSFFSA